MAAQLKEEDGLDVEIVSGGFGELSVSIDGRKVVTTNRFVNPIPGNFLNDVRAALASN